MKIIENQIATKNEKTESFRMQKGTFFSSFFGARDQIQGKCSTPELHPHPPYFL
jgi:hypothetical protein